MGRLVWHKKEKRFVETGISKTVLYPNGGDGVAWNGVTAISSSPDGAEDTTLYADNFVYARLKSAESYKGGIEAFQSPKEFGVCDGSYSIIPGLNLGQQVRRPFNLCYRTEIATINPKDSGYKIHLIYNATASPSSKQYQSKGDSPEVVKFSWDFTTTPVILDDYKPFSEIILDSRKIDPLNLNELEAILYGTKSDKPYMPSPDALLNIVNMNKVARRIIDVLNTHKRWIWNDFSFVEDTVPIAIERESLRHVFRNPSPGTVYIQPSVAYSLITADKKTQKFSIVLVDNKQESQLRVDLENAIDLTFLRSEVIDDFTYYYYELTI